MQDLQIDSRVSRTQYQYTLEDADPTSSPTWAPKLLDELRKEPVAAATWRATRRRRACRCRSTIDRDTASRLGISPQVIDDTLYDAFGQRQVSIIFTQLNLYRVILEVKPEIAQNAGGARQDLRADADGRAGAAQRDGPHGDDDGAAGDQPPGAVSRGHASRSTWRPASRSATPSTAITGGAERASACRPSVHADFAGTAQAFNESLASEPLLILAALITVYIVLGVLYESYIHPITIISTLPSAGVGALLALMGLPARTSASSRSSGSCCSSAS